MGADDTPGTPLRRRLEEIREKWRAMTWPERATAADLTAGSVLALLSILAWLTSGPTTLAYGWMMGSAMVYALGAFWAFVATQRLTQAPASAATFRHHASCPTVVSDDPRVTEMATQFIEKTGRCTGCTMVEALEKEMATRAMVEALEEVMATRAEREDATRAASERELDRLAREGR